MNNTSFQSKLLIYYSTQNGDKIAPFSVHIRSSKITFFKVIFVLNKSINIELNGGIKITLKRVILEFLMCTEKLTIFFCNVLKMLIFGSPNFAITLRKLLCHFPRHPMYLKYWNAGQPLDLKYSSNLLRVLNPTFLFYMFKQM